MRNVPRIMSMHMSMAASYWRDSFASGEVGAQHIAGDMEGMMRGIQAYMAHPYARSMDGLECVFETGSASLLRFAGHDYAQGNPSVLLVPSLINKAYVLDLMEERSLLRYLCGQGVNAYLLDWGDLTQKNGGGALDDVVDMIVASAAHLNDAHGGQGVHMLGYCMGGTLAVGAAAARADVFASLICMASPWDFAGGTGALTNRVKFWAPTVLPMMAEKGHLTVDWLQILFASLDPAMGTKKFSRFAEMDMGSDEAALFVAVEDWLNDGVCLPEGLAGACIKEWFFENAPMQGQWRVKGQAVIAEEIELPAFIIASSKDKLVELETASALGGALPNARLYDPACGHVGMIAGREAQQNVWEPIVKWVHEHT